jgi:hypothetical protein
MIDPAPLFPQKRQLNIPKIEEVRLRYSMNSKMMARGKEHTELLVANYK